VVTSSDRHRWRGSRPMDTGSFALCLKRWKRWRMVAASLVKNGEPLRLSCLAISINHQSSQISLLSKTAKTNVDEGRTARGRVRDASPNHVPSPPRRLSVTSTGVGRRATSKYEFSGARYRKRCWWAKLLCRCRSSLRRATTASRETFCLCPDV